MQQSLNRPLIAIEYLAIQSILNLSQFNLIKYQKRLLKVITERELPTVIFYIPLK